MTDSAAPTFPCARFIKEIGRGPNGARALSPRNARALRRMLEGRVAELELGAVLLAYRVKGETADELAAMLSAAHRSFEPLHVQDGRECRPVSIPSYNGARKTPNLVPLLSLLLAREGVPVLVHGVTDDPGRVTSAEIFAELGIAHAASHDEIEDSLASRRLAFAPIAVLAPKLARLLALRRRMGVRNSTHTLVKILQPFARRAEARQLHASGVSRELTGFSPSIPMRRRAAHCSRAAPKAKPSRTRAARCRSTGSTTATSRR